MSREPEARVEDPELWSRIAHKIRNPLTSISTSGQLLQARLADDAQNRELADIVVAESERLDRFIECLDEVVRPQRVAPEEVDLAEQVERALAFSGIGEGSGPAIRRDYASPGPVVEADRPKLHRALCCLLANALEALDGGGALELRVVAAEGGARILIADTGPGIDGADPSALFRPLESTKQGHLGLGLAVAKRLVELQGGTLALRSRDPAGAEAEIFLPTQQGSDR